MKDSETAGGEALRARGVDPDTAAVEDLAKAASDPALATAAVAALAARASAESAAVLRRLEAEAEARRDKPLRREIRRALYRLEQRGVTAPAAAPSKPAARPILAGPEPEGWTSAGDVRGDRLLWIIKPLPGGGVEQLSLVVNEPEGLREAALAELKRKQLRALREELEARHRLRLVEVPWRYCDWVGSEGYERARARGRVSASAAQFLQMRARLFPGASPAKPASLRPSIGLAANDVAPRLAESTELFSEPELELWFLPEPLFAPYLERYRALRSSPIVLDRTTQLSRVEEIVGDAVVGLFAADTGAAWVRRLEELAYFFSRTARPEAAARTLAAADALGASAQGGRGIPFCEELVRRSFGLYFAQEAEKEQEQKASSVLVTPDDLRAEQARRGGKGR